MRIAAFQRHAIFDDMDHVCDVLERDLCWAASEGIQIALFPETFLHGHSYDPTDCRMVDWKCSAPVSLGRFDSHWEHLNDEVISLPKARLWSNMDVSLDAMRRLTQTSPALSQKPTILSSDDRASVMASISVMTPINRPPPN